MPSPWGTRGRGARVGSGRSIRGTYPDVELALCYRGRLSGGRSAMPRRARPTRDQDLEEFPKLLKIKDAPLAQTDRATAF